MNVKHLGRIAGMFGIVAFLSAVFNWLFVSGTITAVPVLVRAALAAGGIAFWLIATREEKRMGRGAFYGTMSAVVTCAILAVLVGVNYIAVKKGRSWDLTKEKLFTLSDQTVKTMKELNAKVELTAFYGATEPEYAELNARLDQYKRLSDKLTVQFLDPIKHPQEVQEKNITPNGQRILLKSGVKESRAQDISEQALTNAVIDVTRGTTKKVYFVRGHGERSIADQGERGFKVFADQLKSEGYKVDEIVLAEHKTMPDDAQVVVVAGPAATMQEGELKLLQDWVSNHSGKLVAMIDPHADGGLTPILAGWGIRLDDDIVVDPESQSPQMAIGQQYVNHPITDAREGGGPSMSVYPLARSVARLPEAPAGWTVTELAKTGAKAWGEKDMSLLRTGKYQYDAGTDVAGPVALLVAASHGDAQVQARVAVFGNSFFATNTYLSILGNRDIALNAVAWAAKEESRISIRPKQRLSNHLYLTLEQKQKMTLFAFDLLPFGLLFAGLLVWQTRKSR